MQLEYSKPYAPPLPKLSVAVCISFAASAAAYATCRLLGLVSAMYISAILSVLTGVGLFTLIVVHIRHRKRSTQ